MRVVGAIDDYLYTNEHCADGSRRSVFSGPNREKLMGASAARPRRRRRVGPPDPPGRLGRHVAHRERLQAGGPSEVRYRICGYDGVDRWVHARARPYRDGDRVFVDGIVSDVTAPGGGGAGSRRGAASLARAASANEHQTLHDPLTGLGNRRKLTAELDAA